MSVDLLESPKQGTSQSAPESALGSALRNQGAVRGAPESALQGFFLWRTTGRALESTLGRTPESTPISESTPESTLESTFGGFPVLGSLAGRQTLNPILTLFLLKLPTSATWQKLLSWSCGIFAAVSKPSHWSSRSSDFESQPTTLP